MASFSAFFSGEPCGIGLPISALKHRNQTIKGIVSRDWKGLQMVSFDRFEV
jgi:hypothetical protein